MRQKLPLSLCYLLLTFSAYPQSSYLDTTFTNYFRKTDGWTGGDATISIALPNGETMWLFGDSYIDNYKSSNNTLPCLFQVRNCFTVQDDADPDQMDTYIDYTKSGIEQTYFKIGTVGNTVYWPGHGFVKGDTVFVFLEKYNGTTLASKGHYIAKVLLSSFTLLSITELPVMNGITMGKAVIYDEPSGYYYIYGNKLNWIVFEPYVARTKFKDLVSGNWEFYTGSNWSTNPSSAKKICNDPVSPGFSVIKINNSYHLITQENGYLTCGLGRNIYSYNSTSPVGKFQAQRLLYTVEDQIDGHYLLTYNAQAHPGFSGNNELLISYNVNDGIDTMAPDVCPSQCKNAFTDRFDADSYRPKFVRVPYLMLGIKSAGSTLSAIAVSPNPALSLLLAHLNSGIGQGVTLLFLNKMGIVMKRKNIQLLPGQNELQIDISALPPDIYLLKVIGEDQSNKGEQWKPCLIVKN